MIERAGRSSAHPVPAEPRGPEHGPNRPRGVADPPHVARILALQRSAGNAAVGRLLRAPLNVLSPGSSTVRAAAVTARQRFEAELRDRWAVASVRAGTEADQVAEMRSMTPDADPAPAAITGWQQWDPDPNSDVYDDILDAFEDMAFVLGGIPEVRDVRFLAVNYENVSGTAQARPRHGATYGAGLLNVFHAFESATWNLPQGRSTAASPAQLSSGSTGESRRRILVHELSHGIYERFGNPTLSGGTTQFFRDWEQAAGWVGGHVVQNGTTLTAVNWNNDWPEQPVSAYALSNAMEDFAESLMCFIESPAVLRDRSPARYQFIESRLATWRGALRQPNPRTAPHRRRGPTGDFLGPTGDERYA